MRGAGHRPDCPIDMVAVGLAAFVPVEQRRHDFERQCRRQKQRVAFERGQDRVAEPARGLMALRHLQIVLHPLGAVAGGDTPVDPIRRRQHHPTFDELRRAQNIRNTRQHRPRL
jgi:hypothetical protein